MSNTFGETRPCPKMLVFKDWEEHDITCRPSEKRLRGAPTEPRMDLAAELRWPDFEHVTAEMTQDRRDGPPDVGL